MNGEKAELVGTFEDAGSYPCQELVIENQETIDSLVRALRLIAQLLEVKQDAGFRLRDHTNFVAYVSKGE